MGEKDISEKTLESYNDVFADIINVLIYKGKNKVKPDELTDATARSQYKFGSKLHEQERDVAKYWGRNQFHMALYGIENQTDIDKYIALRCIGYDGAAYRHQLKEYEEYTDEKGNKRKKPMPLYPVVTLVLYFGGADWDKHKSLYEAIGIDEELTEYVNDYKANVVSVTKLDRATVDMFASDFWIVADYFWQIENNKDYIPSPQTITHVSEVLDLLSLLTKDDRFEKAAEKLLYDEKGETNMCEVLDRIEARGEARGIALGEARGEARGQARGIDQINGLNKLLKEAGRIDDLLRSCTDRAFQEQLLEEFAPQLKLS